MTSLQSAFRISLFLLVSLIGVGSAFGQQKTKPALTLEAVLGSPFPSELVAAAGMDRLAWVFDDRGARNLWVAEAPSWQGRAITRFNQDDGTTMSQLSFSPNGNRVVFVRGDGPNPRGELPNPTSDPAGVKREVWFADLERGTAELLAAGSAPSFRGNSQVLFLEQKKLWSIDVVPAAARGKKTINEPIALVALRGGIGSSALSPDETQLAFVSDRGTHSFVGVYDFGAKRVHFLDPGVDRDVSPVWSPDGRFVAFLRIAATTQASIFEPQLEGEPWSIRVVEVSSGDGRELFRAERGPGSVFREIVANTMIVWTKNDYLVFPWERDGFTHLWSVGLSGGDPVLLTPGEFEVEYVVPDHAGTGVVFSSNQDDVDRRHLWQVAATGGPPRRLTLGDGVENAPAVLPSGLIAFVGATGRRPLHPEVLAADGGRRLLAEPLLAGFPQQDMIEPEPVIFSAADGLLIHGQLFRPPAKHTGKRPALVFFHGGSRRHMMLGWHYSSYYHNCYAFHQYMANLGYVVLSVNYRSGIGYGTAFREANDYGATGGSELRDVLGAGLYLRSRADVDPERIGLWGGSYGGYLTAMGLSRASDLFAAGVDLHGVHDWNTTIQNFVPSYEPLEDPAAARLAFESSPLAQVEDWRSPVLLIHGDDDRNVPFAESVRLVEKLREHGHVEPEILVFPDEVHGFLRHESWVRALTRAADFFDRHLVQKPSSQVPNNSKPNNRP